MNSKASLLNLYSVGLAGLTAWVVLWAASSLADAPHAFERGGPALLFFVIVSMVSSHWRVAWTKSTDWVMGAAGHMVLILLLPVPQGIVAVALSKLGAEVWHLARDRNIGWQQFVVNSGGTILAVTAGTLVFHGLHGDELLWGQGLQVFWGFPVLAATVLAYHLTNISTVVGAVTLTSSETPWSVFTRLTWGTFAPELAIMMAGILFSVLWHYNPPLSLLTAAPLYLSLRAFQALHRVREGTGRAVTQMAKIIEYRDTGTHEHSDTLVRLSGRLARRAGLTPDHVEDVMMGAGVHDLGKIGIGNDILLKRGPLTAEEMTRMRQHPIIGETILSGYEDSPFQDCLKIVRHHHERWDGSGYPDGLKGTEIPIGARIITIVDSFDAMTSDRPYRRGMAVEDAIERLQAGVGTQFDPDLTSLFIKMLQEDGMMASEAVRSPQLRVASGRTG